MHEVQRAEPKNSVSGPYIGPPPSVANILWSPVTDLRGRDIGGFTVVSLLGRGGMGEVYRAHDARLGRDVAIKILPPEIAGSAERVARFEREARLLAALSHAHIGTIYGVVEDAGVRGLVLELVEGQTLGDRIAIGLSPDEALRLAEQIADAFDFAHERGIVHRDLKPDNIKITPEGEVKVLDFGIAKVRAESEGGIAHGTTLALDTSNGVVLGTTAFMSPEQARGTTVDKRADIWAFGCVFYQMLTGRQAFTGATTSDTIAAGTRARARLVGPTGDHTAVDPAAAAPLPREGPAAAHA